MQEQFGTDSKLALTWRHQVKGNIMPLGTEKAALIGGGSAEFAFTSGTWTANAYTHDSVDYVNYRFNASTTLVIEGEGVGDILMIGGGGGGGASNGGGGGAGGLIWIAGQTLVAGSYSVVIGAYGAKGLSSAENGGGGNTQGGDGGDTTFYSLTALGGGGGGCIGNSNGRAGGCGGGTGSNVNYVRAGSQSSQPGDSGTYGFGYSGGAAYCSSGSGSGGGGGGGTGGNGGSRTGGACPNSSAGLAGGTGKNNFVNSSTTETSAFLWASQAGTNSANTLMTALGSDPGTGYIGGGAGGGASSDGPGGDYDVVDADPGPGGGGFGSAYPPGSGNSNGPQSGSTVGATNTGSGGGGGQYDNSGKHGGTGIMIIRLLA